MATSRLNAAPARRVFLSLLAMWAAFIIFLCFGGNASNPCSTTQDQRDAAASFIRLNSYQYQTVQLMCFHLDGGYTASCESYHYTIKNRGAQETVTAD
jgi:hypothetical protein